MTDTNTDITTLNSLIATTIDSVDGYTEAAKDSASGSFASMFTDRAAERRQVATMLQSEVTRLGGNPEDDGTVLAGAHRVFLNLRASVTGQDDEAIVRTVEQGEDHIKAKFEAALADGDLSPMVKATIQQAYSSVKSGHDQMRDLKKAMASDA